MSRGFPLQDNGPGMNELFHDLTVEQEAERANKRETAMTDTDRELIERLRRTSDDQHRHSYGIGDYWNAVDDVADRIEALSSEKAEAYAKGIEDAAAAVHKEAEGCLGDIRPDDPMGAHQVHLMVGALLTLERDIRALKLKDRP